MNNNLQIPSMSVINQHGVEMFGGVPLICATCPLLEGPEYDDFGNTWALPFCLRGVKLPVRKGTCKVRDAELSKEAEKES